MEAFLSSRDWILYFLQINLLWMAGFTFLHLLVRYSQPRLRYYSYLTIYFMLPLAMLLSLLINLGGDNIVVDKDVTYNVFYETPVVSEIVQIQVGTAETGADGSVFFTALLFLGFVITGLLIRFLLKCVQLFRFAGSEDQKVLRVIDELKAEVGISRPIRVLLTRFAMTPFSFGWRRPVIVLPEVVCEKCSSPQIRMILRHELVHIYRKDFFVNFLQKLIRILFVYNPLFHVCDQLIDNQRELLCDEQVVKIPGVSRKAYAATLVSVTEILYPTAILPAAVPFYRKFSQLKERVTMIKNTNTSQISISRVLTVMLLVACSFTAITLSELQAAEDKTQRIFQDDEQHVRITSEYVEITKDETQLRFGKDSAEYLLWKERFALLNLSGEDLLARRQALDTDQELQEKSLQMNLRHQELQVALLEEQLKQERQRHPEKAEEDTDSDARIKAMEKQYHDAIQDLQDTNNRKLEVLEQKINLLNNKLSETKAGSAAAKEASDKAWKDSFDEMDDIIVAVRKQLQNDGLIGKNEKYFDFTMDEGYITLDNKRIDRSYFGKYRKLIEEIRGKKLKYPYTVSVIKQ